MEIIKTTSFEKECVKLPKTIFILFNKQEKLFEQNHLDSRLHLKHLVNFDGVYSFRITSRYRCLFYFTNPDSAVFFAIGHRRDIYR